MSNVKNIAEELLQLTNKGYKLDEAIHLLSSTENTLVDDIKALKEGAKLECKVDVEKIKEILQEIDDYCYQAKDDIDTASRQLEDTSSSLGYLEDEINRLNRYLERIEWEKEGDKEEEN